MSDEPEVLLSVADGVGRLTLNRPRALNALNGAMITLLTDTLRAWQQNSEVSVVLLDGAGERGLCAGGDIRELAEHTRAGQHESARAFFRAEYRLNALIAEYPKPLVALMDGITMGGGIGLAGHAAIRVVTERSRLAMPETRIGFCPDVGGTWLLSHAPGELGTYLALNSAGFGPADAIDSGFADFHVPSATLPHLRQALAERADPGSPAEIVMLFDETPEGGADDAAPLSAHRAWIDACYAADTVPEIIELLRARPEAAAAQAADELERHSPTALAVTLAALRAARGLPSLRAALEQEYRVSSWLLDQPDFAEGVRALLIDKDGAPRWSPATLSALPEGTGQRALDHLPADSLW